MISIVGNAKNAGKTTVLNKIVESDDQNYIITSIGLDGEAIDQVTFLEKPQVYVRKNDIVVTAKETLSAFECDYEIIEETNIQSAIGPMVICKILSYGKVLVAGPSRVSDMQKVVDKLSQQYSHKILVDGAFFRQSFAKVSDGTIYVVGANDSKDMQTTIDNAYLNYLKLTLPEVKNIYPCVNRESHVCLIEKNTIKRMHFSSLIGHLDTLFNHVNDQTKAIFIPKTITDEFVQKWTNSHSKLSFDIIVESGVNIQLNSDMINKFFKLANHVYTKHPMDVLAVCINPYSPRGYQYQASNFKTKMKDKFKCDVINVKEGDHNE